MLQIAFVSLLCNRQHASVRIFEAKILGTTCFFMLSRSGTVKEPPHLEMFYRSNGEVKVPA